jgi:trk system potassium uptake protein TrkA
MKIVICGAGEVGSHACEVLDRRGDSVTVVDARPERLRALEENLDIRTLEGNCGRADVLAEAGAANADLVFLATDSDEVNLLAAAVAKKLGAKRTVARVHDFAYVEEAEFDYADRLGIDDLICPEYSTAMAIAQTLRNPAATAVESFARGEIQMEQFEVEASAEGVGRPLSEVPLPAGVRLAAVVRGSKAFIPDGSTVVEAHDSVFLVAHRDALGRARTLFRRSDLRRRRVVVMGGNRTAAWVCQLLVGSGFSIRLFERDRVRAERLAGELDGVTVLNADPIDATVFSEERIGDADDFVAMEDDDEDNIIGGVLARSRGVARVVTLVQRADYLDVLYDIGVDRAFSPKIVAARQIEELLDRSPLRTLTVLARGQLDLYRVTAAAGGRAVGTRLRNVKLTPHWSVIAVHHGDDTRVPGAEDLVEPGDTVLVLGPHGRGGELSEIFGVA